MNAIFPKPHNFIGIFLGLFMLTFSPSFAQTPDVNAQTVASNLSIPWDLEYWGTDTLIFAQKKGEIIRLDITNSVLDTLIMINDVAELQHSGLMGMALHPTWPDTMSVFAVYAYYNAQFQVFLRLQRFDFDAAKDSLVPSSILLEGISGAATTTGARVLTSQNHVFLSTGDINLGTVSQDTSSLNGKILRLNLDGSIPQDNPFPGSPIWTLGHRNPQGLALTAGGKLFASEHGASANDELNILMKGRNYGWPEVSGMCNGEPACQSLNIVNPVRTWTPPIAPCGLASVDTSQVLQNGLLMAGLRGAALYWIKLNNDQSQVEKVDTLLPEQFGRIRDVLVTKDDRIFISTSNSERPVQVSPDDDRIIELFTGFLTRNETIEKIPLKVFVADRILNLVSEEKFEKDDSWNLYTLSGQLVKHEAILARSSHLKSDLSSLAGGYYFIAINRPSGQFYKKIYLTP